MDFQFWQTIYCNTPYQTKKQRCKELKFKTTSFKAVDAEFHAAFTLKICFKLMKKVYSLILNLMILSSQIRYKIT